MAAIVLACGAVTMAWGERIRVNGGQGWDGLAYTEWAADFWNRVVVQGLTRYHAQRVLPSGVVHYALRLSHTQLGVDHIIRAFQILNTIALASAAVLWRHTAHVLKLGRPAAWVGFVALFGCFANLRHALYYPTLTDPSAFFLGMLLVWGYVTSNAIAIWCVAAAGVLTWPALPPLALAMLLLPRREAGEAVATDRRKLRIVVSAVVGVVAAGAFVAVALHYLEHPVPGVGDDKFAQWVRRDLLVVTLPLLVAMLAYGLFVIVADRAAWDLRGYVRSLRVRRTAVAAISVAVLLVGRYLWLDKVGIHGEGPTGAQFACEHTLAAIRGPLWGPVHHVVYFGPIVIVAILMWRRLAALAGEWGPAALLGLAMTLAFAAGSNSRQWNHLFPLLVTLAVAVTSAKWTPRRAAAFAVVTLAWSKLWFKIGYDQHVNWLQWPNQRYFMNHGPYATDEMYLVHLVAAVATAALLAILLFRRSPTSSAS